MKVFNSSGSRTSAAILAASQTSVGCLPGRKWSEIFASVEAMEPWGLLTTVVDDMSGGVSAIGLRGGGDRWRRWMVAVDGGGGWRRWMAAVGQMCVERKDFLRGVGACSPYVLWPGSCLIVCFRHLFISLNPSNSPNSSIHVSGPRFVVPSPLHFLSTVIESSYFPLCSRTQLAP